jgi:two-component system, NarL family, sensor histidine kinase BarA
MAFKRLLGETNLERKFRAALGVVVFALISFSFWFYARQSEELAYDQLAHTGRALVSPIVARVHVRGELRDGMDEFQRITEEKWPDNLKGYSARLIRPNAAKPENQPPPEDITILGELKNQPDLIETTREVRSEQAYFYYGAIRAGQSCVACHRDPQKLASYMGVALTDPVVKDLAEPNLQPGELMAVVRVQLSTEIIDAGKHTNRAILISFAIGTTVLILTASYIIIRYIIVKPVKHLKSVADAIAGGQLNLRSEIQTNDEFETLSEAFNNMLRTLTNMQSKNQKLIDDLATKVDEFGQLNMALYESNRLKGDFLSTMSHELRTPLNSIIGFSEILTSDNTLSVKQQRYSGNIMTSGQQLLVLINDILDLAKMEAGKMRLNVESLDIVELCEQTVSLFRPSAEKKSVELRVVGPETPLVVRQDAGKLRQILSNLVSNAIKFTPEGGRVTITTWLDESLVLSVADTGVGIAPAEQAVIFDKFRQASNPLTREQGGTGLGLSIVRELAKLLGGNVTLQSDRGRGSTFTLRLAARLSDATLIETLPAS